MVNLFKEFSVLLTGYSSISAELVNDYFNLLATNFDADFNTALERYKKIKESNPPDLEQAVSDVIKTDTNFRGISKKILQLWYLGKIDKTVTNTFKPISHYDALIWKTAHAHAPGISGGYFGYWHYKPEN